MRKTWIKNSLLALIFGALAFAQDQAPQPPAQDQPPVQSPNGGWRKFGDPAAGQQVPNQQAPRRDGYQGGYSATVPPANQLPQIPGSLTVPAGTWITVRTTNPLSTDHNQVGDAFTAVLTEPIVVNGLVVARRGQTIQGRVSNVEKAGRVSGTSKLGLELTQVTLVDGQQITLHSQMVIRDGGTSYGRDATAIGATTATGAAIGGAVSGGIGAGIGAASGLVASTVGVLLTRGHPSEIYPETVLTFRVLDPITISTANSPDAFHTVSQQDYEGNSRNVVSAHAPRPPYGPAYGPAYGPPAYAPYYAAPYPYYGFGPSVFVYGGGYYGRGYYGRGYRHW